MTFEIIFVFVLLFVAVFLIVTDYVTFDVAGIIIKAIIVPESSLDQMALGNYSFFENRGVLPLAVSHRGDLKHRNVKEIKQ
ncbi:hypothetical protein [Rhodohalobacter sp.]|uniref:hypothetical protein n=1 Tax=Rhodohalobacter sp. TaxID=1974210 RepID=UPI0035615A19